MDSPAAEGPGGGDTEARTLTGKATRHSGDRHPVAVSLVSGQQPLRLQ